MPSRCPYMSVHGECMYPHIMPCFPPASLPLPLSIENCFNACRIELILCLYVVVCFRASQWFLIIIFPLNSHAFPPRPAGIEAYIQAIGILLGATFHSKRQIISWHTGKYVMVQRWHAYAIIMIVNKWNGRKYNWNCSYVSAHAPATLNVPAAPLNCLEERRIHKKIVGK